METSNAGGRRTVTHEFPYRDLPYVEDLGRKARSFTIQGFVVGDNYWGDRDALISALEQAGPGVLVHPYLGTMRVQCGEFSFTETRDEGGLASFSMAFYESADIQYPSAVTQAASAASTQATATTTAAANMLASNWWLGSGVSPSVTAPTTGIDPTYVKAAASATVVATVNTIQGRLSGAMANLTSQADAFAAQVEQFKGNVSQLLTDPLALAASYVSLFSLLASPSDPLVGVSEFGRLFGDVAAYFGGKAYGSSNSAAIAKLNDSYLYQQIQFAVLSSASTLAVNATYQSTQQAQSTVSLLDSLFGELIYQVTDDALFQAVNDLQVAVDSAIPPPNQSLPNVVNVAVPFPVPSLVLAYDQYGDVLSDEPVLCAMNDIATPFCVTGTVQVLQGAGV